MSGVGVAGVVRTKCFDFFSAMRVEAGAVVIVRDAGGKVPSCALPRRRDRYSKACFNLLYVMLACVPAIGSI